MSHALLVGIYILILGNVLVCATVVYVLWLVLKRQKEGFQFMTDRLISFEKSIRERKSDTKTPQISIPIDDPISKYEQVSLPDDVKINFVED
ncbi:MAG: hypothetical protein IJY58_05315 [Alphaproteobacteria bacterium]|nr:hypothetical protein [Alphaproteobacteria bacterium]MBQ9090447.1 hypothetical protein [Alphaproteobacteria bacterium]